MALASTTLLLCGLATWVPASGVFDRATAEPRTAPESSGETGRAGEAER